MLSLFSSHNGIGFKYSLFPRHVVIVTLRQSFFNWKNYHYRALIENQLKYFLESRYIKITMLRASLSQLCHFTNLGWSMTDSRRLLSAQAWVSSLSPRKSLCMDNLLLQVLTEEPSVPHHSSQFVSLFPEGLALCHALKCWRSWLCHHSHQALYLNLTWRDVGAGIKLAR